MMRAASAKVDLIENIAQKQFRYETIFGEQAEVLRADLPKYEAAMSQFQKSPLIAKDGQSWEPTPDKVEEYLTHCDEICGLIPQDFDE